LNSGINTIFTESGQPNCILPDFALDLFGPLRYNALISMALFELILPIFLVIFLVFLLKKTGGFDVASIRVLNQMGYRVFLPVPVFREISRAPFHRSLNPRLGL
jgi:hypothetical protein